MTPDTEALRAAIEHFESFGRYRNAADDQALYALRLVLAAQSASSDVEAVKAKIRSLWPEIASVSTLGEDLADKIARAVLLAVRLRSPVEAAIDSTDEEIEAFKARLADIAKTGGKDGDYKVTVMASDLLRMVNLASRSPVEAGGVTEERDPERCPICDWPMAETMEKGCVPGNCCYRPEDPAEQRRIDERRATLASAKLKESGQ